MRIAYVAPYQGPELLNCRPILKNLGLAANVKMELISELLKSKGHEVEIISQGEVVERSVHFFPAFRESKLFHADIPVFYASALPIKFVNGFWSNFWTLDLFKKRHKVKPFDALIIYNLKGPQVTCARYAISQLGLPTVVEYEDDSFVDVFGKDELGLRSRWRRGTATRVLESASGCIGVSPHLLSRFDSAIPRVLLRGVVDADVLNAGRRPMDERKNWVAFSGTHYHTKGLEPLISAWKSVTLPDWELHIAGRGELTPRLEEMSEGRPDIVFHGLLDRRSNADFLSHSKIGINPHELSSTPGNVFAFKIIEYMAAGNHVMTTPMGALEGEIESGLTYIPDNKPQTIASALKKVIAEEGFKRTAAAATDAIYGPAAVADKLDALMRQINGHGRIVRGK